MLEIPEGLLLTNLFQLADGTWRANVRNVIFLGDFGDGDTPEEAIAQAVAYYNLGRKNLPRVDRRPKLSTVNLKDLEL